jgi:hypothetical protein
MSRPDVIFVPGMMGDDGLVLPAGHGETNMSFQSAPETLIQRHHAATSPGADTSDEAAQLSPQPTSDRSCSVTDQETQQYSDAEYSHAPFPLLMDEPAAQDEVMTDADPDLGGPEDAVCIAGDADVPESVEVASGAESVAVEDAPRSVDLISEDADSDKQQTSSTRHTLELLYQTNALPPAELAHACAFFCTARSDIDAEFTIPGTAESLSLPQLAFIYQFIKKSLVGDAPPQGQLLADVTGMGETHCAMGLIAVVRLLMLSEKHVAEHPQLHNGYSSGALTCPARDPYGIQCVCVPGILGRRYADRLAGGPQFIIPPSHLVGQWIVRSAAYFLPRIAAKGSQTTEPFVELLS